jgi:arylsulfatase A-like enzyme
MDFAVGQILDALDRLGLADDTIVVYTSDHGDYAVEHGPPEKTSGICSDAITRVPLIWGHPGTVQSNHVATELAELVDEPVTLCGLAGIGPMRTADAKDLTELLSRGNDPVRAIAVTEFSWSRSVRKGQYRLVWYPNERFPNDYPEGFGELYDPESDPWEMENLFFKPDHQETVRQMQSDLLDWLVTTTGPRTALPAKVTDDDLKSTKVAVRYRCPIEADGKVNPKRLRDAARRGNNYL